MILGLISDKRFESEQMHSEDLDYSKKCGWILHAFYQMARDTW